MVKHVKEAFIEVLQSLACDDARSIEICLLEYFFSYLAFKAIYNQSFTVKFRFLSQDQIY